MPFASFEKNEKENNFCSTKIYDCQDSRAPMKLYVDENEKKCHKEKS